MSVHMVRVHRPVHGLVGAEVANDGRRGGRRRRGGAVVPHLLGRVLAALHQATAQSHEVGLVD
eukprot:2551892-Pyramimonas_sp.AAC.1